MNIEQTIGIVLKVFFDHLDIDDLVNLTHTSRYLFKVISKSGYWRHYLASIPSDINRPLMYLARSKQRHYFNCLHLLNNAYDCYRERVCEECMNNPDYQLIPYKIATSRYHCKPRQLEKLNFVWGLCCTLINWSKFINVYQYDLKR